MTISWRRVREADFPLLGTWLAEPYVARWWNHETSPEAVARDFGPGVRGEEPGEDLVASLDGRPFALVQRSRYADYADDFAELAAVVDVPPATASLDYLIGVPDLVGKGVGTRLLRFAVAATWTDYPEATAIIVPVHARNIASWRVLEKAGLRRVAEVEMTPDNPVDDRAHVVYRIDRPVD